MRVLHVQVEIRSIPHHVGAAAYPVAGVDVGAGAGGRRKGFAEGGVGVAAEDGVHAASGEGAAGVVAEGVGLGADVGIAGREEGAAAVADALGEAHGPVGVEQAECADDEGVARDALVDVVAVVLRIDAVAVDEVGGLIAEGEVHGVGVDVEAKFVAQEAAAPEVVVAADQVEFHAGVAQVGEGAQHVEVAREDDVLVFKPEVEEVAQADDPVELIWREPLEEGDELGMTRPVGCRHLQMHIRKDQRLLHSGPNLLSGQMRQMALPTIWLSSTGPMRRLSLLTLRWSPRT